MDYTVNTEGNLRIWSYKGKELHCKNVKDTAFDLLDCELCWLYLSWHVSKEIVSNKNKPKEDHNTNYAVINDLPLDQQGSRYGSRDIHCKDRTIALYFSDMGADIVKNILKTRLPRNFYLMKHCYSRDWASTRIAYSYKDIYKFFDYGDHKIKLRSVDVIIWGSLPPLKIVDGVPDNIIDVPIMGTRDLGLHFHAINRIFFPFYKGNEEFVDSLEYGVGR